MTEFPDSEEMATRLSALSKTVQELEAKENERRERLNTLLDNIQDLAECTEVRLQLPSKLELLGSSDDSEELALAASVLPHHCVKDLEKQFLRSVEAVPPFDQFDIFLFCGLGGLALAAEFLLVGLPPKTKWVPKNEGGFVDTGWVSERLKSWKVDSNNWLANKCKVSFDTTNLPGTDTGFTPYNHRVLSFGHDPSPIGLVYGLMDIVYGGMSGITRDGHIFHVAG